MYTLRKRVVLDHMTLYLFMRLRTQLNEDMLIHLLQNPPVNNQRALDLRSVRDVFQHSGMA